MEFGCLVQERLSILKKKMKKGIRWFVGKEEEEIAKIASYPFGERRNRKGKQSNSIICRHELINKC